MPADPLEPEALDSLMIERAEWDKGKLLSPFPDKPVSTISGNPIRPIYGPTDVNPTATYSEKLSYPGTFPFTRGAYATGYRGKPWTRRPIAGVGTAEETNQRVKELLASGQTGLHFVFDYPTLAGIDSDDPMAAGEIGVSGVPVDSIHDVRRLVDGIQLDDVTLSYSHWGPYFLAFLLAVADERGIPYSRLAGTTQNDVLMYYHSCPFWDLPLDANMKLFTDVVEFTVTQMPRWNPVSISGYNIRDGGCSAVQEIAFTFGDAIAYLDAAVERGLSAGAVARRFSFMLCAHIDFFEEICKMRAMRRMWARLLKDRYGCDDPHAQRLRFHAQTSGLTLTAQQPLNNIVRGTVQALAAALGGAQSMHVSCFDETYGLPTELAARTSLNTQNILAFETGVSATSDPLGGSYFIEALTDELEAKGWELLAEVESVGGMVEAAKSGWVMEQKLIYAREYQARIDRGDRIVVGVNAFQVDAEQEIPFTRPKSEVQEQQAAQIAEIKRSRDAAQARKAIDELRRAMAAGANVMPAAVNAAHAQVSLGEMHKAFADISGEVPAQERRFM